MHRRRGTSGSIGGGGLRSLFGPILGATVLLTACGRGGGSGFTNENDRLRGRVLDLEEELARSERRVAELETQLAATVRPEGTDETILANTPQVTRLEIGRLSHFRDTNVDGAIDTLILYVKPTDGLARFVQLVGELTAHAAVLPPGGAAVTIGQVTLPPAELRAAYRSGVTGTHYTVEVPIHAPAESSIAESDVAVVYVDGRTGRRHEAHRAVKVTGSR